MKIINYSIQVHTNSVLIQSENGFWLQLNFNEYSGKPYYRHKVDTLALGWVKHAGIYIGKDNNGVGWFAHNHINGNTVILSNYAEFSQNQEIALYDIPCTKATIQVIANILQQGINQKTYDWEDYNCQTAVNLACNNTNQSKDVSKGKIIFGTLAAIGGIFLISKL